MTTTAEAPATQQPAGPPPEVPEIPAELDPRQVGIQVEAKLRDWNIPYEYKAAFPLADLRSVDWTQVREQSHIADKETVAEFRTQMGQSAVYPPIVIMHPDVLVDGNNRVAAARSLRRASFPAFVVHFTSVDLARSFNAAMNQLNGRRLTAEEAYQAALTMMTRGMADEAIARELGRGVTTIREMRRRKEYAERTRALPEIDKLADRVPRSAQGKLAQITHDPAFAEAVKLVVETGAAGKVVRDVVKAATTARTDTDAVDAVRGVRADLAPAGPPPVRVIAPPQIRQASAHLGGLLKLGDDFADDLPSLLDASTPERQEAAIARWRGVQDLAGKILRLYGK